MKRISMAGIAAVILLLAALGGTVSAAYTLGLGDLDLETAAGSGDIPITLDSAPQGIAGYSITVRITDPMAAQITGVTLPPWITDQRFTSITGVPGSEVTIRVADVADNFKTADTPPPEGFLLATVTVQGITKGLSSPVTATVNQIDADNGAVILPMVSEGTINVELPKGSISVITTGTTGAEIYLDEEPYLLPTGLIATTNYVIPEVSRGTHTVSVSRTGWIADAPRKTVVVESGQEATVTFAMVKAVTINVLTTPPGADIIMNGAPGGQTPASFSKPYGFYTVSVSRPGCTGMSGSKNIKPPFTTATFSWTLTCTNDPDTEPGRIIVDSVPQGAMIYYDGRYLDADTPGYIETLDTSPSTHTVQVALEGYRTPEPWTGSVNEDGLVELMFELEEEGSIPVPEFPTILAPLVSILGIILVITLLKRKGS